MPQSNSDLKKINLKRKSGSNIFPQIELSLAGAAAGIEGVKPRSRRELLQNLTQKTNKTNKRTEDEAATWRWERGQGNRKRGRWTAD